LPALSFAGASLAEPCPVSTARSSNRTCGLPASGSRIRFILKACAWSQASRRDSQDLRSWTDGISTVPGPDAMRMDQPVAQTSSCLAFRHSFRRSSWIDSGVLDSSSIAALPCCFVGTLKPGFLPSTGVTQLQRYYEPLRHPPTARRPSRLLAGPIASHRRRISRVACCSLLACRHPPPRRSGWNSSSSYVPSIAAFPQSRQGRPSHRVFRGRLGVHACYSLPTCRRPNAAFCLSGSDHFVTSVAAEIATRLERPLPGQDLHLLEQQTFHGAPGPLQFPVILFAIMCL